MRKRHDLTGKIFFDLSVISFHGIVNGKSVWNCICSCGNDKRVTLSDLKSYKVKSCGCLRVKATKKSRTTHGMANNSSPLRHEYWIWIKMKQRCLNTTCRDYKDYGGRGIKVHEPWVKSFQSFISDMGPRPSKGYCIERIDNNGNYEPDNCIWATRKSQSYNRRSSNLTEFKGELKSLSEWCSILGLHYHKTRYRVRIGMTLNQLINNPSFTITK